MEPLQDLAQAKRASAASAASLRCRVVSSRFVALSYAFPHASCATSSQGHDTCRPGGRHGACAVRTWLVAGRCAEQWQRAHWMIPRTKKRFITTPLRIWPAAECACLFFSSASSGPVVPSRDISLRPSALARSAHPFPGAAWTAYFSFPRSSPFFNHLLLSSRPHSPSLVLPPGRRRQTIP